MKFGAIDIGTNAARLLIGEVAKDRSQNIIKKISYTRIPLRLGEDVFDTGFISDIKRVNFLKTIQAFKLISDVFCVSEIRACATSAMRNALNKTEIVNEIKELTGVEIEIIDGNEEGELIFNTFFLSDFTKDNSFIVIDVGGGSTEISVFSKGRKISSSSFEIGTIRILKGKNLINVWNNLKEWLSENIDLNIKYQVFATGGNINKIHKLLGVKLNESIKINDLKNFRNSLFPLSIDERINKYKLKEDRADVIVPACDIFLFIMNVLNFNEIFVPKVGLADGIIYDLHINSKKKTD